MDGTCPRHLLATGDSCRVERCSCGTLHVSVGPVTMRLEPSVAVDAVATIERALDAIHPPAPGNDGAVPPPHDPTERELAQTVGEWEVRVFADDKFGFFVARGLWHVQLWHPKARVSVLTPSRLTGEAYEVFPVEGWKRRVTTCAEVAQIVSHEHAIELVDEDTLCRIERIFVRAPMMFAASPEGAS